MDTQEKEKKSEEIAAQTTQTKEQPVPAQPSYAELKKEKAKAEAEALKTTLPAGKNEWSTGLLIRFANPGGGDFSNSDAYKWLSDHSVDYGFVIRYPENKTEVTGIETAQPQVFRFVGVENAKKMRALAFCVEEYADYIQEQKAGY